MNKIHVPSIDELLESFSKDKTVSSQDKKEIIQKFRKIKLQKLKFKT